MGIKVVLLLFCVVVVTECQIGPDFFYPGSFFNSYSNNRNDNTSPFKNPPGTFHSQTKPQLSINPYAGFTSQQQLQLNQRGDQEEQEYKKPQSTFGQQPQKNSRNPSATNNNSFEPTKSQYEQNQNIDRKQQSINRGQNSEYSPTSSNLNYNNQDQSGLTENSQRFPSQSNKPQSGFSPSYQSGQQSGQSNLRPGLSNQGQSYNGNRNNPSISSQPNNYYRPVSQGQQQVGLNSQNRQPNPQNPYVQREEEEKKYEDYSPITEFSWNLFKRAVITQKPNFVISPLSPQHILSYLASGAEGETRNEIITAIKYNSPNQLNSLISTMLREPGNKELQLASALFVSDRIRIREDFKRNLADNTKIVSTDFSNTEKFNREYSKWVAEKTKGVIKNSRINPEPHTRMLMTSAVYFKGEWIFKLNPGGIDNFYVDDNTPVKVPMMKLLKKLPYGKLNSGDAEWISLPYNSNDSMVIVLPRKGLPVEALIERLNVQEIFNSMNIDNYGNITLTLPRFKVESSSSLINPLQQMGIRQLFSTNAQLPNIFQSSEPLQVSNVLQQASLEVNEEGSIATSLTAFAVVALSFSPPTPDVVFTVDRPFIAMIIDRKNNFPYFIAKISNPAV